MKRDLKISVGAVKVFVGVPKGPKENKDHPRLQTAPIGVKPIS